MRVCVYTITCIKNKKTYVGQSKHIKRRWKAHCKEARKLAPRFWIARAIKKHGCKSFKFKVVRMNVSRREACKIERHLIARFKSVNKSYNNTSGGENIKGWKHSHRTKKRMALTHVGFKGGKHSLKSRKLISIGVKKAFKNPIIKRKCSNASRRTLIRLWKDPLFRKRMIMRMKKGWKRKHGKDKLRGWVRKTRKKPNTDN